MHFKFILKQNDDKLKQYITKIINHTEQIHMFNFSYSKNVSYVKEKN